MIGRILIALLLTLPAFGQLQLESGKTINATATNASTIAAWVSTDNSDWHHYAKVGTNTYIDAVASAWSLTPWTYDGTNLVAGNTNCYVDALTARTNALTSAQLAHYVLETADRYNLPLSQDMNLLAIAEPWDYTAGNASCLGAWDTENLGVPENTALGDSVWNGLVAYYSMRSSGTTVYDEFGTNTGTAVGSPTFDSAYGVNGVGVDLNWSSSQSITTPVSVSGATNFSVALWVKWDELGNFNAISNDGDGYDSSFRINTVGDKVNVNVQDSLSIQHNISGKNASTGIWYFVCYTKSGSMHSLYVDDDAAVTQTQAQTPNANALLIGRRASHALARHLNGKVDEVAIFNRALSSNEVLAIATTPKYYAKPVIRDRSSYGNDATANGAPVHVLPDREYRP